MRAIPAPGFFAFALLLLPLGAADAALLDLTRPHYPQVFTTDCYVSYDPNGAASGGGLLSVTGWPVILEWWHDPNDPSSTKDLLAGDFTLRLEIDPNTGLYVPGSAENFLEVTGDPYVDKELETLFSSTTATGFGSGGDDLFDFLFTVESGVLAPPGSAVYIVLNAISIVEFDEHNPPVFNISFHNDWDGTNNAYYLPEPVTATFLALGGLGIVWRRRRAGP